MRKGNNNKRKKKKNKSILLLVNTKLFVFSKLSFLTLTIFIFLR